MKKMKKSLGLFLILSLSIATISLQSCGNKDKKDASSDNKTTTSSDDKNSPKPTSSQSSSSNESSSSTEMASSESGSSSCAQIAEDYGKFVDSYIEIYQKFKKDPSDAAILSEYTDYAQKSISLSREMQSNKECGKDLTYAAEILKHSSRMAKGMSQR